MPAKKRPKRFATTASSRVPEGAKASAIAIHARPGPSESASAHGGSSPRSSLPAPLLREVRRDHEQGDDEAHGALGEDGQPQRAVHRGEVARAPRRAALQAPEGDEGDQLEQRQHHVQLGAPRAVRELEGGEQQRAGDCPAARAEQPGAEPHQQPHGREAAQRRGQARGDFGHRAPRGSRQGGGPEVQGRLLGVGLAVQVEQGEAGRAVSEGAQLLRYRRVAGLVRGPQVRRPEAA